ncbi:MAG: bifunctional 3-deoxy-7-phosphoheptulonate synthase/chorismate mutase type II [Cyclobacteriaceae bacterium]|nr:bifunctional 3-deoxy-7-phosphoheptulonate synthase/chorismate mutase type II [Cyclobacteriaceae bacterium]
MDIKKIEDWGLGLTTPLWIAGPCSAESKEQIESISQGLVGSGVQMFRAGIWKPRTRPNAFEGVGEEGLKWLEIPKKTLNIPVCVEVANAKHTEAALKAGVDVLWLGARTTVNPFSVQEVCDAVKGTDIPVMVKNPINPDQQLWIGAIERLLKVGITKIAGIHRGCSDNVPSRFRNNPEWSMPILLKKEFPTLSVVSDPSHICGNREMIEEIGQTALNFGLDGLMVETHHDPDNAWSDAKQQITPERLKEIINNFQIRHSIDESPELKTEMDQHRQIIDVLDKQLIEILSQRFKAIREVGQYKKEHNLSVFQRDRWDEVINTRIAMAIERGVSEDFMRKLLMDIHDESIKLQEASMHTENK